MAEITPTSYDVVPYESFPFAQTHPDRLATVARLFGMAPPPVDRCRVLELGCASGGNLLPMALTLPDSTFVGIDLSARQVEDGHKMVTTLGLKNLQLQHRSILDVDEHFGRFDYLLCHGVYSWVPNPVQDKILEICAQHLAPNGVAYVSYNTYPGWHMNGMLRDMMVYHARRYRQPEDRVNQARALLDFLAQATSKQSNAFGTLLKEGLEAINRGRSSYLLHEYLEEVNDPIYFYQFVERATAHGLQYLGEAQIGAMLASNFPPEVAKTLHQLSSDLIEMEQFMDFVRGRKFRQTLLCHQNVALRRQLTPQALTGLFVAAQVQPASAKPDLTSNAVEQFQSPTGLTSSTGNPLIKAALVCLGEAWPSGLSFEALVAAARGRLARQKEADRTTLAADTQALGANLLHLHVSNVVELHVHQPAVVTTVSERPAVSRLTRLQAEAGLWVTNLRHELVRLNEFERHLLRHLDGTRDRPALREVLKELAMKGILTVRQNNQPITDVNLVSRVLTEALEQHLPRLARNALLVG
jgi:methyltransferase-like protein